MKNQILKSYKPKKNETMVCVENFDAYDYKVYAIYLNGEYDKRIKVKKNRNFKNL
jgi:hypothetical protein